MSNYKKEIKEINDKGFTKVNHDEHEKISKMQESGEYFLDLAPDPKEDRWIIRKYPSYKIARSMLIASWVAGLSTLAAAGFTIAGFFKEDGNNNVKELELRQVSMQRKIDSLLLVRVSPISSDLSILKADTTFKPDTTGLPKPQN
jgi:hypothetical protein